VGITYSEGAEENILIVEVKDGASNRKLGKRVYRGVPCVVHCTTFY
jgi:hypothetical protein